MEGERAVLDRVDPVPAKPRPEGDPAKPGQGPAGPAARTGAKKPRVENPGFENVGELVFCARFRPEDSRVQALLEMGTGESGGLPIPDEIDPTLREVAPQEAIMRPRAVVVPAGDSPDADLVLPSHGDVVRDHHSLIASYRARMDERRDAVLSAFAGSEATAYELGRRLFADAIDDQLFLVLSEIVGHLDVLEAEGTLESRSVAGRRLFRPMNSSELALAGA